MVAAAFLGFCALAFAPGPRAQEADAGTTTSLVQPGVQELAERTVIRVAYNAFLPPFEFANESKAPDGFGVELVRAAAQRLGVQPEFIACAGEEEVAQAILSGEADIRPIMFESPNRRTLFLFGPTIGTSQSVLFVSQTSPFDKIGDLTDKRVAAIRGSVEMESLNRRGRFRLVGVTDIRTALRLLLENQVDAVGCNRDMAFHQIAQNPMLRGNLRLLEPPVEESSFSVAGLRERRYLIESVSGAVEDMRTEDKTLEGLYLKWFLRNSESYLWRQRLRGVGVAALVVGALLGAFAAFYNRHRKAQLERIVQSRTSQLEERNREFQLQHAIAQALQRDLPVGQLLGAGLEAMLEVQELRVRRRGAVFVLDAAGKRLVAAAVRGLDGIETLEKATANGSAPVLPPASFEPEGAPLMQRALGGEFVVVETARTLPFPLEIRDTDGDKGHFLVPMRAENRVKGVLCLFTEPGASCDERRRVLLEALAAQMALVAQSHEHEQGLLERERRLRSLYEIALSLGASLELSAQFQTLFMQIRRVMPADAGNVWVSDRDVFTGDAEVYYSYDTREDGTLQESYERSRGHATPGTYIHKVFTTGEPIMLLRTEEEIESRRSQFSTFGVDRPSRSLLYVPLKYQSRVIGVLTVQSYRLNAYNQESVDLLMSFSAPLAVIIENARLFETVEQRRAALDETLRQIQADLMAAQAAQQNLLPREFPNFEGWRFAAIFMPSLYVGGDIYNVFRLDDEHFGLYHIDVSGHGVPAALFSVGLNQILTRDLTGPGVLREDMGNNGECRPRRPEQVIAMLDEENLFQKHQRFFTMIYLVANIRTGLVQFYRAGHNEPLLVREGEEPEYIQGGGALIGFKMPRNPNEVQEIQLKPGDRLIIYSDGVNEAADFTGDQYGQDRMAAFLGRVRDQPLQESLDSLVRDVQEFTGSENFEDDVSMIALRWDPPNGA